MDDQRGARPAPGVPTGARVAPAPQSHPMPAGQPSLSWDDGVIVAVDQRALPGESRVLRLASVDQLVAAIGSLAIRGAPAIGLAGALGVALSARHHHTDGVLDTDAVRADVARLAAARPTAVNLAWAVRRAAGHLAGGPDAVLAEALAMLAEDAALGAAAVARACDLVLSRVAARPMSLLTHCNTGRLATAAVGTALGVVIELGRRDLVREVLVDETRPLLQGARLTAWELGQADIAYRVCVDSAAPAAMARGLVDCVLVGADRIAANGDVANKIGTYGLAIAAARHGIPFVVVAPESTWDRGLADGSGIVIEERDPAEVTTYAGLATTPPGAAAYNPAFDVTPAELITAIVSENRTFLPGAEPTARPPGATRPASPGPTDRERPGVST
ncbi:S-methyl-5-thioribose-1-phosphate isomerase [Streptomyces sp. NPDC057702]|uniref:S-methyl-5-thioribose-1-phosphate isomerase n=1 Tax=unclassified Streptomyces TaxID=2593676 RepID=UPI0036794158